MLQVKCTNDGECIKPDFGYNRLGGNMFKNACVKRRSTNTSIKSVSPMVTQGILCTPKVNQGIAHGCC